MNEPDLLAGAGDAVTEHEFAQIAAFLEDEDGADALLTEIRCRMERGAVLTTAP